MGGAHRLEFKTESRERPLHLQAGRNNNSIKNSIVFTNPFRAHAHRNKRIRLVQRKLSWKENE